MNFSDEHFKELEEQLKIKNKSKEQLRSRILHNANKSNKRNFKYYGLIAVACMLLIITSPFYSSTMESIAGKVLPISITPSFSDDEYNPDLSSQLFELVEKEGYNINFLMITPSPYTIEISLTLKESTLKQAKDDLEPKITNHLYENGYDHYELKISKAPKASKKYRGDKTAGLYDEVIAIVEKVFISYGYAEEDDHGQVGFTQGWFSNSITLDIPDHIEKSTDIIADIEKEITSRDLDIKRIEVTTFNLKHRLQDYRWAYIASDIYDAMAGKSMYQLTGMSYKVKKGHTYVEIKTDFESPPSEEVIQEIELAIQAYLALPETQEDIQNDKYTIQLLLKNEESFINITN